MYLLVNGCDEDEEDYVVRVDAVEHPEQVKDVQLKVVKRQALGVVCTNTPVKKSGGQKRKLGGVSGRVLALDTALAMQKSVRGKENTPMKKLQHSNRGLGGLMRRC